MENYINGYYSDPQELSDEFRVQFAQDEVSLTSKRDYVLGLCADIEFTRLAAGLSSTAVKIYDLNTSGSLTQVNEERVPIVPNLKHNVTICGVRFLSDDANMLLVGTTNGQVRLFDLRTTGVQACFEYKNKPNSKASSPAVPNTITCFDRNANSRIICSGTEQHNGNVYLLFFDVRERKQLGFYSESHEDDVTTVRFHARNTGLLCTGGTDGLINVFDVRCNCEENALVNTINTESSVHRLNWQQNDQDIISCITHTNDFRSYESQGGDEVLRFNRPAIKAGIRLTNMGDVNLINAHSMNDNAVFLLAGTSLDGGNILRSVAAVPKNTLKPHIKYSGNKQIVRDSLYDMKRDLLITGGECGFISVWTPSATSRINSHTLQSSSVLTGELRRTPY